MTETAAEIVDITREGATVAVEAEVKIAIKSRKEEETPAKASDKTMFIIPIAHNYQLSKLSRV